MAYYLIFLSLIIAACASHRRIEGAKVSEQDSQSEKPGASAENSWSCDIDSPEFKRDNLTISRESLKITPSPVTDEEKEEQVSKLESGLNRTKEKYSNALSNCGPDNRVTKYFGSLIPFGEKNLDTVSGAYKYEKKFKRNQANRLAYYKAQKFGHKDRQVSVQVSDIDYYASGTATFKLDIISVVKTKILQVKAVQQSSYLAGDGTAQPLFVLNGIEVFDEFGNRYSQISAPTLTSEISPDRSTEFSFKTKGFIAAAKVAILRFKKFAFGNAEAFTIKVKLFIPQEE